MEHWVWNSALTEAWLPHFGQLFALEQFHNAVSELGVSRGSVCDLQVPGFSPLACSFRYQ